MVSEVKGLLEHIYVDDNRNTWWHQGQVQDCSAAECRLLVERALRQRRDRIRAERIAKEKVEAEDG